jgi:hypothetical protein
MTIQLSLLDSGEHTASQSVWSGLPESARRDVAEAFAKLLVAAVARKFDTKEADDESSEDPDDTP